MTPEDQALGRSWGGLSTRLHVVCDGNGLPRAVHITAGQRGESSQFEAVCGLVEAPRRPKRLLGDRGYDAKRVRAWLRKQRIREVIPKRKLAAEKKRRRGRPPMFQKEQYARRNAAEGLIGWLKEHRGLATRFDKTAASFLTMVKLACIRRLLRAAFPHKV